MSHFSKRSTAVVRNGDVVDEVKVHIETLTLIATRYFADQSRHFSSIHWKIAARPEGPINLFSIGFTCVPWTLLHRINQRMTKTWQKGVLMCEKAAFGAFQREWKPVVRNVKNRADYCPKQHTFIFNKKSVWWSFHDSSESMSKRNDERMSPSESS